jgi:hypothetical protein
MFAQSSAFLDKAYNKELISETKKLMKDSGPVSIKIDEMIKATDKGTIGGLPKIFELYISIKSNSTNFFEGGKYLSGLYIDDSGIYDIANGSFFDAKHLLTKEPQERFVIEGTKLGKFYIILTLSSEVPYFGDFLNEKFNADDKLGQRYVENVLEEIKNKDANVFVFELDSTKL